MSSRPGEDGAMHAHVPTAYDPGAAAMHVAGVTR